MSDSVRIDKQLLIAAIGIAASALTAGVLGIIETYTGFALYSLMFWFILPVGAVIAGFGAASGYYIGARLFNQKPAGGIAMNMLLASISAYLLVHYIPYYLLEIDDGTRIKDIISFWRYLDIDIRSASISFRGGLSTGELGSTWGYLYAFLQLIGFSFGSLIVFSVLSNIPYCEKCSKYLTQTNTQKRYTSNAENLSEKIQTFATLLNERQYVKALEFYSTKMGSYQNGNHVLRTQLTTHKCKTCNKNHFEFVASRLSKNDWQDIEKTRIRLWVDPQLDASP